MPQGHECSRKIRCRLLRLRQHAEQARRDRRARFALWPQGRGGASDRGGHERVSCRSMTSTPNAYRSCVRTGRQSPGGERYVQELVPGARETIEALRRLGKPVYVVSGGLLPSCRVSRASAGDTDVTCHAVPIEFDASGSYQGFDQGSPLPRADGKAVVCRELVQRHGAIAMVGDGMTDVAARAGGAYVIGLAASPIARRWRRAPTAMSRMPSSRRRSRRC